MCIKNQQNAWILHDSCTKNYQNTRIFMIFARKICKIPEFYTIFSRKMRKFYVIIAREILFPTFRNDRGGEISFSFSPLSTVVRSSLPCLLTLVLIGVGDGGGGRGARAPLKFGKILFGQLLHKIRAFFGQKSCKIREFCNFFGQIS